VRRYDGDADQTILLDRSTGARIAVSRTLSDVDPPSISGDGNRVLFGAGAGNSSRAYIWDRVTDGMLATFLVGDGVMGALSHDGRFLAFFTRDTSFTDPPPHFQGGSVVVDLATNDRWQASVNDAGEAGDDYSYSSDVSDDGQRVVFGSVAMNLVPGKPKRRWDAYLYDHSTRTTVLAARSSNGGYPNSYAGRVRISGDGRIVAFVSDGSDIVAGDRDATQDIFVWDTQLNTVTSFTLGRSNDSFLELVNVSREGRFVLLGSFDAYVSEDQNDGQDAFVYDRALDRFELVTRARDGLPLRGGAWPVALSADGRVVAFQTRSPELAGDAGGFVTCFSVRER
jgi:Tol biopolymer transport system component